MDNPNLIELLTRIRQESRKLREGEKMKIDIFLKMQAGNFISFQLLFLFDTNNWVWAVKLGKLS